ncbi:MAG: RecX family transcriptional regulator [Anaerolineae bacterium]|nr:RecX family transcriptional regulator [Anaerolineae bacterium]MDQ7035208.1 RecX family transcriptional regulator [Anaerolineae bacterium]
MRTITLLERQKKNKARVSVYLDGEFAFGINEMDAAMLRKGQQLSESEVDELRQKDAIAKAFDAAATLLAYRPRSTQEVRQRLLKKSFDDVVIDTAIEKLERLGYLDDRAFARFWIEDRNRFKPRGRRALSYELRNKGISDSLIQDLLDELVNESDGAYEAAQKRVRSMRGKTQREFKKKIGAFLQRRGFGYEAVNNALNQLIQEITDDDLSYFAEGESDWY